MRRSDDLLSVSAVGKPVLTTSIARRLSRALRAEPWWLRGLTWRIVGMGALLAFMQNALQLSRWLVPAHGTPGAPWEFVLFDLARQLIAGLCILLIATVLINIERPRIGLPLALAVAVAAGTLVPIDTITYFVHGTETLPRATMIARRVMLPWAIAAAAWYFLHRATIRQAALRAAAMTRLELEAGMLESRLQALQAQVEPHFLFNTLAHVRRLYRTDPARARRMLDSFRGYLKSALPQMRGDGATLGRELDLVRTYLEVQQVRMGRRLIVRIDAPAALRDRAFPPMMLLSLVENAIKHGLNPLSRGGTIEIGAAERDGSLEVTVADDGRGIGDKIGSGVGLANIRVRLTALHGPRATLALAPNPGGGVRATITIPAAIDPDAATRRSPDEAALVA